MEWVARTKVRMVVKLKDHTRAKLRPFTTSEKPNPSPQQQTRLGSYHA